MAEHTKIQTFTDLEAWKVAHSLVIAMYEITRTFPKEEQFGIINQMRRAGVSITSNIAEGFSRISNKEKLQFYAIALGSLTELQNQLLISRDIGYLKPEAFSSLQERSVHVHKLINGLSKYLRNMG